MQGLYKSVFREARKTNPLAPVRSGVKTHFISPSCAANILAIRLSKSWALRRARK